MKDEQSMQCWPSLTQYGSAMPLKGGNLFYYDTGKMIKRIENTAGEKTIMPEKPVSSLPVLVLIHGLGDEADSFRHLIPLLSRTGYRILAPDLPGFGRSTGKQPGNNMSHNTKFPWKGKLSLNEHAGTVLALMKETSAVSTKTPAVLIGSSMGAIIAQIIAGRQPELVKAIIVIDGCHPLSGNAKPGILLMALPFIGKKWYRNFRKDHEGAWKSLYMYYRDLDAMNEEDKNFLRNRVINRVESISQEQAYFSSLRSMIGFTVFGNSNFSRRGDSLKTLLLWGEADRVISFEQTSRFRSMYPQAEYQLIAGAGHLPHQEAPEDTAAAILNWLK